MLNSPPAQIGQLLDKLPAATRQTGYLVGIDAITNLVDYGFHVYLGRALLPAEFAILQTLNAVLLVVVTGFSVMEPVISRQIVEAEAQIEKIPAQTARRDQWHAIFQTALRMNASLGVVLFALVWINRQTFARWIRVPVEVISVSAFVLIFALLRPVISGTLQGQHRFIAFGLTRSMHALGRLTAAVILVSLGAGLPGAVASFPVGSSVAVIGGLCMVGPAAWKTWQRIPEKLLANIIRLSAGTFIAYSGYMTLLNSDLIWINRGFSPVVAGNYAAAVLLRRVLMLLPGAVTVVMYPRAVKQFALNRLPDRLLIRSAAAIIITISFLAALYFAFGNLIVQWVFGTRYVAAGPLLGWMALGILGYSLSAMWMNFYLATRPLPYIVLLGTGALLQNLLLAYFHASIWQVTAVFAVSGWFMAVMGLLLYLTWFRSLIRG
jgi:O-antigen/teichoic acid export membrane protein